MDFIPFGFLLHISSGDELRKRMFGVLVYLNLFSIETIDNSWVLNWVYIDLPSYIKSFGSISIYVVSYIDKTGTREQ